MILVETAAWPPAIESMTRTKGRAGRSYFGREPSMKAFSTSSRCCFIVFPAVVASPAVIALEIF
jgi:hypothetical protein